MWWQAWGYFEKNKYDINAGIVWCVAEGLSTRIDWDTYVITLVIYERIELGISDIYFGGYNDSNLEGLVTWFLYGINAGVRKFDVGGLVTCFDVD